LGEAEIAAVAAAHMMPPAEPRHVSPEAPVHT
jgi:hypothetical protein